MLAQILQMTLVELLAISAERITKAQLFGVLNVIEEGIVKAALVHGEIYVYTFLNVSSTWWCWCLTTDHHTRVKVYKHFFRRDPKSLPCMSRHV